MGLKRWTGSGYEDVNLARHRASGQYVPRTPTAAFVWDGGQYKKVWPSITWPQTGAWGPLDVASPTMTTYGTFTVPSAGSYTITHTTSGDFPQYQDAEIRTPSGANTEMTAVTVTKTLNAGDLIEFRARNTFASVEGSGTWTVTPT